MIRKLTLFSLLIWLAAGAPVLAKTFWVKNTDVIQDSIAAAQPGDTVKILAGTYQQNFFVTKPIKVLGCNFPHTIINPQSGEAVVILDGGFVSCLNIKSEAHHGVIIFKGGTIKNCVIQGCEDQNNVNCAGIRYMGDNTTVINCIIHQSGYHGIYGADTGTVTLINNILINNRHHAGYSYGPASVKLNFNCYYQNEADGWGWIGGIVHGDSDLVSVDPMLDDNYFPLYRPLPNSPLFNRGDTAIFNLDGSRSDIGVYGGPDSCTCFVPPNSVEDNKAPVLTITITPNPATDMVVINYQLPNDGPITITISNFLGQIMATPLARQWQTSGKGQFNFPLTGLPSGSYFCTVKTIGQTMTNKFIVIK